MQAFCLHKQDYRTFKLSRINNLKLVNEYFTDTLIPPPIENMSKTKKYPLLKLKFNKTMAYRVYDEFDPSTISIDSEGNLLVSVEIPEDLWLYGYLLSFGSDLEILEPISIKNYLAKEVQKIYLKYYNMT